LLQRAKVVLVTAGNRVEFFRLGVVGFQNVVGNRPIPEGTRDALAVMPSGMKVVTAGAHQSGPVKGRSSAQDATNVQLLGGAVLLALPFAVRLLVDEHRLFVVNVLARGEFAASF